jgi:hypothetical protein
VLTAFVNRLTGFNLVDATELEDKESPISDDTLKKIQSYQPITLLDRLFDTTDSKCNNISNDAWTDRVFDRCGVDRVPR